MPRLRLNRISLRQREWIARLERELPNLREMMGSCLSEPGDDATAGLAMAAALFQFWLSRGLLSEGRHWLDRALARVSGLPTTARVEALYADSVLADVQGDLTAGSLLVEEAQALDEQLTDPVVHARIAHADGLLALYSGDIPRACARLEEALAVFGARRNLSDQVWILLMLGLAYELQGDAPRAIACHERVLDTTEAHGESVFRSYSLWASVPSDTGPPNTTAGVTNSFAMTRSSARRASSSRGRSNRAEPSAQ
ncbi:hypothetical protein [Rhodococcus jostii]|uniref:hypothetical protein n=1 Tax=Rhodococcus jostii TaxID=132919 RepID=UPI003651EA73